MAFCFRTKESAAAGFRRLAISQISRARRELAEGQDHGVAVHEARKCLKRVRALLRLVRPALSDERYRRENARFRDIGRMLSASRDRQVMRETVASLAGDSDVQHQKALQALAEVLSKDMEDGTDTVADQSVATAIAALDEAKKDLKGKSVQFRIKDPLPVGLKRSYKSGQRALAAAKERPNDDAMHDWRKTVQAHWRHALLLSEAWPAYLTVRANLAKELSDLLGLDHDLAVLIAFVEKGEGNAIGARRVELISALASARQQELRAKAFAKGELLFADGAKELAERVQRYRAISARRAQVEQETGEAATPSDQNASSTSNRTLAKRLVVS
ncbi:CHAD domain-containing protein [Filomicrobium sp.]|uniref:CHAD domain-containing protein n=1 Tax=Filomicrobium sp. TaxID=2024831 RepID=UPI00258371B1|nr:CHAD domain-containing protein [Filomicrobium sp.]MCV0369981.1 CHAD domain-containing protein [Filomicrobium sp.]